MNDLSPDREPAKAGKSLLERELKKGIASGVSKRSPEQVRTAFRKARVAA